MCPELLLLLLLLLFVCLFILFYFPCGVQIVMFPGNPVAATRLTKNQANQQFFSVVCVASLLRKRCSDGSSRSPRKWTLHSKLYLDDQILENRPHNRQATHRGSYACMSCLFTLFSQCQGRAIKMLGVQPVKSYVGHNCADITM